MVDFAFCNGLSSPIHVMLTCYMDHAVAVSSGGDLSVNWVSQGIVDFDTGNETVSLEFNDLSFLL